LKIGMFHLDLPAPGAKPGGVAVFVDRLASALALAGEEVEVVSLSAAPAGAGYRHRRIFTAWPALRRRRFLVLYVLPLLLNFVGFRRYDVVHLHGGDWFWLARGVATVRTFYGSALWEARAARGLARKLSLYSVYPLEHLAGRLADVTLGLGEQTAEIYRTDGIARLFAPAARFYPGEKTAAPSFVFIGTWGGRKRGRFVHEVFTREVLPQVPDAVLYMAADFVPAGAGVVHLPSPTDEALAAVVRRCWVLLSASTYEGFGLPYLEALMSGTVVLTTANAGAAAVLQDGGCGMIVPAGGFGPAAVRLAREPGLRAGYAAAGLSRAAAFAEAGVVAEQLASYRLAISRRNAEPPA
jgi:glycosyltransferase involved in cell wall biosynthesis